MHDQMWLYVLIMLFSVFISSASQILLKKATQEEHESIAREYLNPKVLTAYFIYFCSMLLTMFAYRGVPLSMGPVIEATSYIYITAFGIGVFKERITRGKMLALTLILLGILFYSVLG